MDLPLHPFVVHIAIGLALGVALLAPTILLAWARDILPRRCWWLVPGLQAVLLISALAAVRSGEVASLDVRDFLELERIDRHEARGDAFAVVALATLALGIGAGLQREERRARRVAWAAVVGTVAQLALGAATGHAGGHLVWGPDGVVERARTGAPSLRAGPDGR